MDLLPGALVVQQQRMQQTRLRNTHETAREQRPAQHRTRTRRAVRRGLGRTLIVVGTALVQWAEPA